MTATNHEWSPIFVVGVCGRAGTTLVAAMLDRHSRIAVPPETHFFPDALPRLAAPGPRQSPHDLVRALVRGCWMRDLGLRDDEVLARLRGDQPIAASLLRASLESYSHRAGKPRCGEKTPRHIDHVDRIFTWYPSARVICMIRDGRDTVMSLMGMPWANSNLVSNCMRWRQQAELAARLQERYRRALLVVRYEDLVADPERAITAICTFVGESFEPAQLETHARSGVVPSWELGWKAAVNTPITSRRVGRWRLEATAYDVATMEHVMGPWLRRWSYSKAPSASRWLRAAAIVRTTPQHQSLRPLAEAGVYALRVIGLERTVRAAFGFDRQSAAELQGSGRAVVGAEIDTRSSLSPAR